MLKNALFQKSKAGPFHPLNDDYAALLAYGLHKSRYKEPLQPMDPKRPDTFFRASSMGKACLRRECLKIVYGLAEERYVSPSLAHIFAKGHAYHEMHQNQLLPAVARDAMLGWWSHPDFWQIAETDPFDEGRPMLFSAEDAAHYFAKKSGRNPPPLSELRYHEVFVYDKELGLRGHPDMIVDWSRIDQNPSRLQLSHKELWDFKTRIGLKYPWEKIDPAVGGKPLEEHVWQLCAYMLMLGIKRGRIIYLRKQDSTGAEDTLHDKYAEHLVALTPEREAAVRAFAKAWHAGIGAAYSSSLVPVRTMCNTKDSPMAKKCHLRNRCFGLPCKGDGLVAIPAKAKAKESK